MDRLLWLPSAWIVERGETIICNCPAEFEIAALRSTTTAYYRNENPSAELLSRVQASHRVLTGYYYMQDGMRGSFRCCWFLVRGVACN